MTRIILIVLVAVAALVARTIVVVWMPARAADEAEAARAAAPQPAVVSTQTGFGDGSGGGPGRVEGGVWGGGPPDPAAEAPVFGDTAPDPAAEAPRQVSRAAFRVGRHFRWTMPTAGLKVRPFAFQVVDSLPDGLELDGDTGDVRGSPTAAEAFRTTVRATDAEGATLAVDLEGVPAQP